MRFQGAALTLELDKISQVSATRFNLVLIFVQGHPLVVKSPESK